MTETRLLKVAIVGAGPAGFYAAGRLLAGEEFETEVNLFDRLPVPFGLVRFGVAPDHPKIKSVTRIYEKIAAHPGFRFFGNVEIGRDLVHADLAARHHAVIYATGAAHDRRLGIPGEDLAGSHPATDLVAWYNGHPDACDHEFDLSAKRAVVIGNGNVAVDVARMLALSPRELEGTDIADHALEALRHSKIEEIVVLGRRGLAQAAFTNPELRELGEMEDTDILVDPAEVELDEHSARWLQDDGADARARKNVEIATGYSTRTPQGKRRRIVLRFLTSPVRILGQDRVEAIEIVRNELLPDGAGRLHARPTVHSETLECGLVFRSIGYRGTQVRDVPFDDGSATIRNVGGRVVVDDETAQAGVYAAGWIKRGPSGIIGTNKRCAYESVDALLEDHRNRRLPEPATLRDGLDEVILERQLEPVDYRGWQRIDAHEQALGEAWGRPRVKLTRIRQLLDVASGQHR